jgi:hypothetical protein
MAGMHVRYGDISARCECCGSAQFEMVNLQERIAATSLLACANCGTTWVHGDLLCQIGDEATRQSRRALYAMKVRLRQKSDATFARTGCRSPSRSWTQ